MTGNWVEELRRIATEHLADGTGIALDLGGVVYADRNGAALLRDLQDRGIELRGASGFLRELLREGR